MLDYDTENLNSEEIYSSLRGVTEAIEKFSFRSQEDLNEPIKRDGKKDCDIVSILGQRTTMSADLSLSHTELPGDSVFYSGVKIIVLLGANITPVWISRCRGEDVTGSLPKGRSLTHARP